MKTYNVMLQSVPTKLNKQLEETIPKVAIELDKINTKRGGFLYRSKSEEIALH